jgi:hypothetical protein
MCGGSSVVDDIISGASDLVSGAGDALASIDSAVNSGIPGGWGAVGGAALMAAGIYDPTLLSLADSGTLTEEAISSAGFDPASAAQSIIDKGVDYSAGLSANAPVDTTLSQAAANAPIDLGTQPLTGTIQPGPSGLDYTAASPDFVGPTGTPDIPAADAAAQANQTAVSQSGNILGNTTDASGNVTSTFDDGSTMTVDQSGNVVGTTEAPSAGGLPSSATDIAKSLAKQAANKLLSTAASNLAIGKGIIKTPLPLRTGSYSPNISGSTTGDFIAPNLTPDLTKGNIDFTLMGAPTAATTPQIFNLGMNPAAYAPIATAPQQTPMFAQGGEFEEEPQFYSVGGLESMNNHYVQGDGDGTSDSVNAKLADGEFVIPADVVAKLGNGSNNAGANVLDQFLSTIREHKQENGTKLEPDSKGPLAYLLDAKKKAKV